MAYCMSRILEWWIIQPKKAKSRCVHRRVTPCTLRYCERYKKVYGIPYRDATKDDKDILAWAWGYHTYHMKKPAIRRCVDCGRRLEFKRLHDILARIKRPGMVWVCGSCFFKQY